MKHRDEIDGLRALAVLPVVFYHAGFALVPSGFLGVDIFFVISGYLITYIVLEEVSRREFSLRTFYERRARRVLPALFVVLASCFPFAFFLMYPDEFKAFGASVFSTVMFSSNYFFYKNIDYFNHDSDLYPLLHTWSLSVEEQFYLFLPPIIWLCYSKSARSIIVVILTLLATSCLVTEFGGNFIGSPPFIKSNWAWFNPPSWNFYLLPSRAWEILLGSVAACLRHFGPRERFEDPLTPHGQMLSALGVVLVCASSFVISREPTPGLASITPTCGALLIILFAKPGTLAQKILSNPVLVGVGLISYSFYLWHQPIFAMARLWAKSPLTSLNMLELIVLSGALAYLTWLFVERPSRNRVRVRATAIWSLAGAGSIFFFIAGGLVWRLPTEVIYGSRMQGIRAALMKTATMREESRACHTGGSDFRSPEDACVYFSSNAKLAVLGDSHGVELAGAIADHLKPIGQGVKQFTYSGCAPMFGQSTDDPCAVWTEKATRFIANDINISTVVVIYRINYYIEHTSYDREKTLKSYVDVLEYLMQKGKSVVLVLPVPELEADISRLILNDMPGRSIKSEDTVIWSRRMADVKSRIANLPSQIAIVDASKLFCDPIACRATEGEVAYYMDDNHPSVAGARKISDAIFHALGR